MAFENITKGNFISHSGMVSTKTARGNDSVISVILVPSGVNMEYKTESANADFVSFAFNLQQKLDISLFEETVAALEYLMEGIDGLPNLTAISGVLTDHYEKAGRVLSELKQNK